MHITHVRIVLDTVKILYTDTLYYSKIVYVIIIHHMDEKVMIFREKNISFYRNFYQHPLKIQNGQFRICFFVCLVLNDASTLMGH